MVQRETKNWSELSKGEQDDVMNKVKEIFASEAAAKDCELKITSEYINDISNKKYD